MKNLNENMMKNLSFPDFQVEKMEFSPREKILKVYVEGAWLDADGGTKLGKGVLFFNGWEALSIRRYNSETEKWSLIDVEPPVEQLIDLCEFKFIDSTVFLFGFGKNLGQWMEWEIVNAKMHGEFES